MGVSEKSQVNKEPKRGELEANHHKKWVIAGIQIRAPLKPILITEKQRFSGDGGSDGDDEEWCSTTPTSEDARIPAKACPPPPPRKRKSAPARGCSYGGAAAKEFFCPPDLETVFVRRHVA